MGVAGPCADVDDVKGLVDEVADGYQLVEDEGRGGRRGGKVKRVGA